MKLLKLLLLIVIVGLLLYFSIKDIQFQKVMDEISRVKLIYPVVFLLGIYLQFFIRAYRWGILLKPYKNKIPMVTLYNYIVIGFLLNLIPGKIGEPARGILLAGEEKISRSYGLASVVLERLIDSLMIVLLFLVSLFFVKDNPSPLLNKLKETSFIIFPIILLFFLLFYLLNRERVFIHVEKMIRFISRILPGKIRERAVLFGLNFVKGLRLNLSFYNYMKLLLSSIIVWLFLIPFYWFLMQGFEFGADVSMVETVPYFSIIVVSAAVPTPGMAGSFEWASRHGLEQLHLAEPNPAFAYTVLAHLLILTAMVIPGLAAFWIKRINMKAVRDIRDKKIEQNNQ
ncbi:MAG: flippase-like domain-containing protein [Candidatus Aminicenantes bacterium]|nr:MAG: flippase-like domain-containing protein [Candidatus Aminicenantes bacterium]